MATKEETAVTIANLPERLSPDSAIHSTSTDREGNTFIVPEKPSEDGYNWRKYGQKNVKGNEYIRSYYKCSHPNCAVKKQVERSQDGRITDITYLGNHGHVIPHSDPQASVPSLLSVKVQIPDCPPAAADEDTHTPSDVGASATDHDEKMDVGEMAIVKGTDDTTPAPLTPSSKVRDDHNENLAMKKRKKGVDGTDSTTEKANHESRVVVHTVSEVDIVNDGYRWRKYGQKMVKGSPNPRSYYRCSTTGCPVKKHVERASHDSRIVITTYEGEHDHGIPPIRTIVSLDTGAFSAHETEMNGVSKLKLEESDKEKVDSVHPTTFSEENKLAIVVKTDEPISRSTTDQEASQAKEKEPIAETQEDKIPTAERNMVPETVSTEVKPSVELDKKPEVLTTEVEKSNGLETPNAETVNC